MENIGETKKIVIVDGNPASLGLLSGRLMRAGYEALTAKDSYHALGLLEDGSRIIICDWSSPPPTIRKQIDIIQLLKTIRSRPEWGYVYFIITGDDDKQLREHALDAGADDFLSRPIDDGELQARLRIGMRITVSFQAQLESVKSRLHKLAMTDELTDLPNCRYGKVRIKEEWSITKRTGQNLAVAMIDLDSFKEINDLFGHQAGDAVLCHVGSVLREAVRTEDIVCRLGGDEFLVIFPQQGLNAATLAAERCREAVERHVVLNKGVELRLTASIGVSAKQPNMRGLQDLLLRTDHALYKAKKAGGNRVHVDGAAEQADLEATSIHLRLDA